MNRARTALHRHHGPSRYSLQDGHFVPNLTIGHPVVASLRKHTQAFIDCHLMVSRPDQWVEEYAKAGANMFTFHVESLVGNEIPTDHQEHPDVTALCRRTRDLGMQVGLAVKPSTSHEALRPYIDAGLVDMALIMTVEPGFGGQKFMPDMMAKVRALRADYPSLHIQVDGGLSPSTIDVAAEAGANVIVAGSAVFGAADPGAVIQILKEAVNQATINVN